MCARRWATELTAGGFVEVHETQSWPAEPGRYFLVRGGSLIAWSTEGVGNAAPFRIVGGHTDSPNLAGQTASRPHFGRVADGGPRTVWRCVAELLARPAISVSPDD